MTKITLKLNFLNLPINPLFIFPKIYHLHIIKKIKKKKKILEDIKIFLKNNKKKYINIAMNHTKIYHKMKNKSLLSIEKNIK